MKKVLPILVASCVLCIAICDLRADSLCIVQGGTWNTSFSSDNTNGWTGGASDNSTAGMGSISTSTPSWRAKHTKDGVTTVISGRHKCSTQDYFGDAAPTNTNGRYCHCQRTLVNGAASAGVWVFRVDDESVSHCSDYCAIACAGGVLYFAGFRAAVLAVPVVP